MALASGELKVLSENDMLRVHEASLKILEETGIIFRSEEAREIFKKNGAKVSGETVYIPRKMMENALETTPISFKQHGLNSDQTITIGSKRQKELVVSTQNGCVYIQDLDNGRRLGTAEDYANITKLCQASDIIKVVGGIPAEPSDMDPKSRYLDIIYELLKHTDKPLLGVNGSQEQVRQQFDMIEMAAGKKGILQEQSIIGIAIDPLSPLKYDYEPTETILAYAKHKQPVYINSCIMAGITGPIHLLGTATLMNAEILGGIALIQLVNPGSPVVYVAGSTVGNMKNASFIMGSPECHLVAIAGIQMANEFYNIPSRNMAGATDAKIIDCQAGYETMQNIFMSLMAGVNFINISVGCLDSIMTTSYEKFVIDEELIKRILRIKEGIDVSEKALSVDIIQEVGHSGNYIMHPSTLEHYKDRWQPSVSCWDPYGEWEKNGSKDVSAVANKKYKQILADSPESLIDKELDNDLQAYIKKAVNL